MCSSELLVCLLLGEKDFSPSMLIGSVCPFVCLFVCLFVCALSTTHSFVLINFKLRHNIRTGYLQTPIVFGPNRSKVKVKVTKNVKNTFLVITFDPDELETSN